MSANHAIVAAFAQRLPLVEDLRRQVLQARKKKLLVMSALRAGFVLLAIAAIFSIGWLLSGVLPEDSPLIGVTVLVLMAAAGVLFAMLDSFFSRRFTAPPLPFAEAFRDRVVVPTLHSACRVFPSARQRAWMQPPSRTAHCIWRPSSIWKAATDSVVRLAACLTQGPS
jgi:hypothetical protein